MKKPTLLTTTWLLVLLAVFWLTGLSSPAQIVLTISGEVTKPLTLQGPDLKAMAHTQVSAKDQDGTPLPPGIGPYRIVVPGEKKPARWIREVKAIEIRFAK